jgi:hypothetical protein
MSNQDRRGSDALVEAYRLGSFTVEDEVIEKLARAIGDWPLHHVLVKGQPAVDSVHATFTVRGSKEAATVVGELLGSVVGATSVPGSIRIFPRGIPWPGEYTVGVDIAAIQG